MYCNAEKDNDQIIYTKFGLYDLHCCNTIAALRRNDGKS